MDHDIKGIPLKKAPYYKKAPPLLCSDLEQGGAFLSLIRAEGPRKFWDILH